MSSEEDWPSKVKISTRNFLIDLDDPEVEEIKSAINSMRSFRTITRFLKWCALTMVAAFMSAASLGDAIMRVWGWLTSGGVK